MRLDDARQFRQAHHGIDVHADHATRRNVVDNDGKAAGVMHGLEVLDEELHVINCKSIVPGWSVKNARWENEEPDR